MCVTVRMLYLGFTDVNTRRGSFLLVSDIDYGAVTLERQSLSSLSLIVKKSSPCSHQAAGVASTAMDDELKVEPTVEIVIPRLRVSFTPEYAGLFKGLIAVFGLAAVLNLASIVFTMVEILD